MSIHEGHRQRLMERFHQEGLDHFDSVQVLELLLFYCIPRRDTNELAHRLLNRFGSVSRVMDASLEDLMQVPGVGRNTAVFLHLVKQAGRFYQVDSARKGAMMKDMEDCGNFLLPYFIGRQKETVFLLCLNANCNVISCREVGRARSTPPSFLPAASWRSPWQRKHPLWCWPITTPAAWQFHPMRMWW